MAKHQANRLNFAVLLMFFRTQGRFPRTLSEVDPAVVEEIAGLIAVEVPSGYTPNLSGRTAERHRAEIRALLGFREAFVADADALEAWLRDQATTAGTDPDHFVALIEARCRTLLIEPPSADRSNRIVRAAIHAQDERFYAGIRDRLAPETASGWRRCGVLPRATPGRRARRRPCCCDCAAVRAGPASRTSWPSWR